MKHCPRCGATKPLDQFGKDPTKASGRMSHCRSCRNAARRQRYYKNIDHELARQAARRAAPAEQQRYRTYSREWYRNNRDRAWVSWLKNKHGMRPEQWHAIYDEQAGLCYLCQSPLPAGDRTNVVIDHDHTHCPEDHSCGACRRGLAHGKCNTLIGLADEDVQRLRVIAANFERQNDITRALIIASPAQMTML